MSENGYRAALYDRPESILGRAMLRDGATVPASIRDLLATLDLWCDLSATLGHHLRDSVHALRPTRYGLVLRGGDIARPAVFGPLCGECTDTVARVAVAWKRVYNARGLDVAPWSVELLPWSEAVRRAQR